MARITGLEVVREGIQDRDDNVTFFLVACRVEDAERMGRLWEGYAPSLRSGVGAGEGDSDAQRPGVQWKTLITFRLPHSKPGALADVLLVFKEAGVNVGDLHQCPHGVGEDTHAFVVEVEGRRGEAKVDTALAGLEGKVEWRWLGSLRDWRLGGEGKGGE